MRRRIRPLRSLGRWDRRAFDAVAASNSRVLDTLLPPLTRSADNAAMWGLVAAALGATGSRRLRRAALRAAISVGVASPIANIVGKQLVRRARPDITGVPPVRLAKHVPGSTAFPSGHSATAAAFAVAVAAEAPLPVAVPVLLLAAGVGASRVYTGVHYPGDVLAGVALGAACGLLSKRLLPPPRTAEMPARLAADGRLPTRPDGTGLVAVLNAEAGTARKPDTRQPPPSPGVGHPIFNFFTLSRPRTSPESRSGDNSGIPGTPTSSPLGEPLFFNCPRDGGAKVSADSGTVDNGAEDGTDLLRALPGTRIIEAGPDDDLAGVLDRAAADAEVLAVSGGDGTIGVGAAAALRHDVPLLVVPSGTLDHFARALGLPTRADAIDAYRAGRAARVDVGRIDGGDQARTFCNTAGLGVYAELVAQRARLEKRLGKWPALAVAAVRVLRDAEPVACEVDGAPLRVWAMFVGNCRYATRGVAPARRASLTDGLLDVRLIVAGGSLPRVRALYAVLAGPLGLSRNYLEWRAHRFTVRAPQGGLRLAADGEMFTAGSAVRFGKRPRALRVVRPA